METKISLDIKSIIQLLQLNNPFYIITDKDLEIRYYSEASNKIFNNKLQINRSIHQFFIDFDTKNLNEIFHVQSACKKQKFKFNSLYLDEYIIFVFSPVINYDNPITNYNLNTEDFNSINYLSEYISLSEKKIESSSKYENVNSLLNYQNKKLIDQNKTIEALGRLPKENPNPVIRINREKKILLKNKSANRLNEIFNINKNNIIQSEELNDVIETCLKSKEQSLTKIIYLKNKIFNLTIKHDEEFDDFNLYLTDITEHNKEVNELKTFYEDILDQIAVDIVVFDKKQRFVYINKNAIRNKKLRAYLIGKTDLDYFKIEKRPEDLAINRIEKIKETFNKKTTPTWIDEYGSIDNKTFIIRKLDPIIDNNNNVVRVVGTGIDITTTIKYKQSLIENEKKWKTLVKNSSDLICLLNTKCEIIFISNSVKNILGYQAKNLINSSIKNIIHKNDILNPEDCCIINEDSKINHNVMRFKNNNGKYISLRVAMSYNEDLFENPCIIMNAQDISELKRAEAQRFMIGIASEENERRRLARDLHDGVGQYLATTVLYTSLLGKYVEKEMSEKGKEAYQNTLKMLKKTTDEVRYVSHNIMPSSIKDFGFLKSIHQLINDLKKCNPSIKFLYIEEVENNNIGFSEYIGLSLFRSIQQIFNNSLKHAKPTIIKLSIKYYNGKIRINILDNGIGFNTNKINYKDGIGIKSINDRVQNLGGEMNVKSKINRGTLVKIVIGNLN